MIASTQAKTYTTSLYLNLLPFLFGAPFGHSADRIFMGFAKVWNVRFRGQTQKPKVCVLRGFGWGAHVPFVGSAFVGAWADYGRPLHRYFALLAPWRLGPLRGIHFVDVCEDRHSVEPCARDRRSRCPSN